MTRSEINKKVHARLSNMLAHAGEGNYTREEWATIVRPLVAEHGSRTKVIAREARDEILARREASDMLADLAREEIAHDPIAEAAAWMPRA